MNVDVGRFSCVKLHPWIVYWLLGSSLASLCAISGFPFFIIFLGSLEGRCYLKFNRFLLQHCNQFVRIHYGNFLIIVPNGSCITLVFSHPIMIIINSDFHWVLAFSSELQNVTFYSWRVYYINRYTERIPFQITKRILPKCWQ